MKDKPDNITILNNFQFKKIRTILRAWEDLHETVVEDIKKAQAIFGRRWYATDNLMDDLCFPAMLLIDKACPPGLMIEQVEQRSDEVEEKIKELDHISIDDVDRLIKWPFVVEGKIHIYICVWHKLAKNEIEDHKCDAQLGIESSSYPDIEELLGIWKVWRDFIGY